MRNPVYESLINAPRGETALATFSLLSTLQDHAHNRGIQVNAAILLAVLVCERFGVSIQDAMTTAKNLLNSHDDRMGTEFEAIRWYLREEVQ